MFQNCLKWVVYIYTLFLPCIAWIGRLFKFLRILITAVYFKDRNWMFKTLYCISCSEACKIGFWPEFPDIPDNAGKVTRRRRKRTQAIAKRYAFHTNAIKLKAIEKNRLCFKKVFIEYLWPRIILDVTSFYFLYYPARVCQ